MIIALYIGAYLASALAFAYIASRLSDDAEFLGAFALLWPIVLPILLVIAAFDYVIDLGGQHRG